MRTEAYEVVVVGGGPAGAAAAITLARAQQRVLLVEQSVYLAFKIGEALPPSTRPLLEELQVWETFLNQGHLPSYGNLSAWGSPHLNSTDFIFDPNGPGWHLDRPRFDMMLRKEAADVGAELSVGTKLILKTCELSSDSWLLSLSDSKSRIEISSRWVIDATGRRSSVARVCAQHRHADDALVAFFALFSRPENSQATDHDSRTLIEAAPDGWWYTALLPSGQRVVAHFTDADLAPQSIRTRQGYSLLLSDTQHIRTCLQTHDYRFTTAVKTASANSAHLLSFTGPGWIAVGDAAVSFDPVSSQGILNALFTGIKAGQAIAAKLSGNSNPLSVYEEQLAEIYDAYLRNRSTFYGLEKRWVTRPFWRRRVLSKVGS